MKPNQIVFPIRMDWKFILTLIATIKLVRPKIMVITSIGITSMKKVKQGKVYNYRAVVRGYQKESRQAVYTEFELTWDHLDDCTWWPIRQR